MPNSARAAIGHQLGKFDASELAAAAEDCACVCVAGSTITLPELTTGAVVGPPELTAADIAAAVAQVSFCLSITACKISETTPSALMLPLLSFNPPGPPLACETNSLFSLSSEALPCATVSVPLLTAVSIVCSA